MSIINSLHRSAINKLGILVELERYHDGSNEGFIVLQNGDIMFNISAMGVELKRDYEYDLFINKARVRIQKQR